MRRLVAISILAGLVVLIAFDTAFHFDQGRVEIKRQHQSAQRHWSWFYPQDYVYEDSPFKYRSDIKNIGELVEPNKVVLTDKATSYYLAAGLPVFVKNVHLHHFRKADWNRIFSKFYFCYVDQEESLSHVRKFIDSHAAEARQSNQEEFKYWLINRDPSNLNMRYDCLAARGSEITIGLESLGNLIYEGEYLWLYEID